MRRMPSANIHVQTGNVAVIVQHRHKADSVAVDGTVGSALSDAPETQPTAARRQHGQSARAHLTRLCLFILMMVSLLLRCLCCKSA